MEKVFSSLSHSFQVSQTLLLTAYPAYYTMCSLFCSLPTGYIGKSFVTHVSTYSGRCFRSVNSFKSEAFSLNSNKLCITEA